MAEENKVGRPLKFESAEELKQKIDEYFESCYEEEWYQLEGGWKPALDRNGEIVKRQTKPFTVTGLAAYLGTTRKTLLDYENKYNDEFSNTIRASKARIEAYAEESLWTPKIASGVIFNLTNNFGWVNKQEVDNNIGNKDGKPFETTHDLSGLSVEELKQLERIVSKTATTD